MSAHAIGRYLFWVAWMLLAGAIAPVAAFSLFPSSTRAYVGVPDEGLQYRPPASAAHVSGANPAVPLATDTPSSTITRTPTRTLSPTFTRTRTVTPTRTATACPAGYNITQSTGATVVPGTALVAGSDCDDCVVTVALPFSYSLYSQVSTQAIVGDNDTLGFVANSNPVSFCTPTVAPALDGSTLP